MSSFSNKYFNKAINPISYCIIVLGFLLRLTFYLHNRSLVLDEANIARNIYERNFCSFLLPLNYEQFAPPGFLCVLKIFTNIFGYSEYAFRLYPFLCSIGSLIFLFFILRYLVTLQASWYALLLFATGLFFLRYATEAKQYSSDIMITLSLLLLALKFDINKIAPLKFIVLFGSAGAISIWFSMPSIFILAALGAYYSYLSLREGSFKKIFLVICIVIIWASQFFLYYKLLLQSQIHSDYLQNWHSDYFPALIPHNAMERNHTLSLYLDVFRYVGGNTKLAVAFNLLLLITGLVYLFIKDLAKGILFSTPILCLYVTAGMHHFTLLPRVVLFIMPVVLIIMAIGLQQLFKIRYNAVRIIIVATGIICFINFNELKYFFKPFEVEDFKQGLNIAQQQNIKGSHLHIGQPLGPLYIYYLQICPQKKQWPDLLNANVQKWDTNYDSLAQTFSNKDAVIYEWIDEHTLNHELNSFRKYAKQDSIIYFTGGEVYIFTKTNSKL